MKINVYKDFKEAVDSFTKPDKKYQFERHVLKAGEAIELHKHEKANEWIVIDGGEFTANLNGNEAHAKISGEVVVLKFPKGKEHSFKPISAVSYHVYRDRKDRIVYVKEKKGGTRPKTP